MLYFYGNLHKFKTTLAFILHRKVKKVNDSEGRLDGYFKPESFSSVFSRTKIQKIIRFAQ